MFQKLSPFKDHKPAVIPDPPPAVSPTSPGALVIHKLDFVALGFPEYEHNFAMVIDNAFTADDCAKLVAAAEASKAWEIAQINGGQDLQYTDTTYRNSGRIMLDDQNLADNILERIRPYLGNIEKIESSRLHQLYSRPRQKEAKPAKLKRVNERLRFLRYGPGQFFKPHCDGAYFTRDRKEVSYYTLHLYLNGDKDTLEGGATRIFSRSNQFQNQNKSQFARRLPEYIDIESRTGRVLIFEQKAMLHSGEEVTKGLKMSMRTDIMYDQEDGDRMDLDQ